MPRSTALRLTFTVTLLLAASCGPDQDLQRVGDSTTPESEMELRMTEKQRDQQNYQEEERKEAQEFDAAEGGGMTP